MENILKTALIIIFLGSAMMKLVDFENTALLFSDNLKLPFAMAKLVLSLSIIVELFLSFALLKDWQKQKSVYFFALFVFMFFIILNLTFINDKIENCGCMGAFITNNPVFSIIKSSIMLILFVFVSLKKEKVS